MSGLPTDAASFSAFPGVDLRDVYSFLDRHHGATDRPDPENHGQDRDDPDNRPQQGDEPDQLKALGDRRP